MKRNRRSIDMHLRRKHKVAVGAAALLAAAGGGAAIAASSQSGSTSDESKAIIDDAAKQLGISADKLSNALKTALNDRIDAAVAAGRLTKAEGDALKQRVQSSDFPFFGGLHHGFGHFGARLDAAASYLGLTPAELRTQLEGGKSLAQVARDRGKSVDGLVDALVADAKQKLDRAVAAGRLTKAQETDFLTGLKARITALVNGTRPEGFDGPGFRRPDFGFGFRFRHFEGPPA
jgi:hypothetical protein